MKKANKRIANKQKLKTLEWSDDEIQRCTAVDFHIPDEERKDDKSLTSMESKIARVQARKKEAEEREKKKKRVLSSIIPKRYNLDQLKISLTGDINTIRASNILAEGLNHYFEARFLDNPVISNWDGGFPLWMYSSTVFDELLKFEISEPLFGACLVIKNGESFGHWLPCKILNVSPSLVMAEIEGIVRDDIIRVHPIHVCLTTHNLDHYIERIIDACKRRSHCVSLMRYFSFIHCMPFNQRIISSMTDKQHDRIYSKAASTTKLLVLDKSVAAEVLAEAKNEFEMTMNRILFNINMMASKNELELQDLALPYHTLGATRAVPDLGLVKVPAYNLKSRISYHRMHSFLSSTAAVISLQMILRENKNVDSYEIAKVHYVKPFTLDKFERFIAEQLIVAGRIIKQDWPMKAGQSVRNAIVQAQEFNPSGEGIKYDVHLRNVYEFEKSENPVKPFLERINLMMSDVLKGIVKNSLLNYTRTVEELCGCHVKVEDIRNIVVHIPENSIYKRNVLPPLFIVAFRIAAEDKCLNLDDIEQNKKEISVWMKSKEAEAGEKCPIKVITPIMGKAFEYSQTPSEFKEALLKVFKLIVTDFLDVPHIQKYVMDKIYFPNPKYIDSITMELPWVIDAHDRTSGAIDKALEPLVTYLKFFKKYENFVNLDNLTYINGRIQVTKRDPESTEIELPVNVNLNQVISLIDEHLQAIKEIEDSLPITPIECGLFLVDVVSVRNLLLDKHRLIIKNILSSHAERCSQISLYLEDEFKKINKNLARRPENIEQLVELEDYMQSLGNVMVSLQNCINEMTASYNLLEKYRFKTDMDSGTQRWNVFGAPAKVHSKCVEVQESNIAIRRRFLEEMLGEQATFTKTLHDLDSQVSSLEDLTDLSDVVNIAARVKEVENRIINAQSKVKVFNSRETLFEQDITDYEELNRIQRNFEPYLNLWQTAKEWIELSAVWKRGRFIDLNAEEVERNVDKYNVAITKAAKFFLKADMKQQSTIANKIKAQVTEFVPEVPMIVTLRNPGMRDRHWEKIAQQLNVDIFPIENFSTEQIIALNLKDSLDLIQKIGESAAKEYQIEQALDKMEKEWENINLNIHSYRETGTGVLKGVDDINVVLDEQITMTQVIFRIGLPPGDS